MPKLFQINTCLNHSTGNIAQRIGEIALKDGWESWIAYSNRNPMCSSASHLIPIGSKLDSYIHAVGTRVFDSHDMWSTRATKKLIKIIDKINPDIIQLHIVHGYYLDMRVLFEYLRKRNTPLVWTFHDCWAMTGHCAHFDGIKCMKWKSGCYKCKIKKEYPASMIFDRSIKNYNLKKQLFTSCKNLTIVPVSEWLNSIVKESFLKDVKTVVIKNGIDVSIFQPTESNLREKFDIDGRFVVLGVATGWYEGAGLKRLNEFIKLSERLDDKYRIVLIGLEANQITTLPQNIIGLQRTADQKELAEFYSMADVFVNPTYQDSLPTVNMEALACGTPVITYNTGGSPEILTKETGWVVERGDIESMVTIIEEQSKISSLAKNATSVACRKLALDKYDKNERFLDYLSLYKKLYIYKNI